VIVACVPAELELMLIRPSPTCATAPLIVTVAAFEEDSVKLFAPNGLVVKFASKAGVPEPEPRAEL
jgi:hypothetical protein